MYAVIESCGKQYKVAEGDVVFFEKLDAEEGKKVAFDKVILVSEDGKVQVGNRAMASRWLTPSSSCGSNGNTATFCLNKI